MQQLHSASMSAIVDRNRAMLRFAATEDYLAARCCILNGLFSGFVLASQAVEKFLKALLLEMSPAENLRKHSHSISTLGRRIQELDASFEHDRFASLFLVLEEHYKRRYPDNWGSSFSSSTEEIDGIDELVCYLEDRMTIADELKYRSGIFATMFFSEVRGKSREDVPSEKWLWFANKAVERHAVGWHPKWLAAWEHRHA